MRREENRFQLKPDLEQRVGFTQAVRSGETLYVTGSVSADKDGLVLDEGNMVAQLRNAFNDVKASLEPFGATFSDIVKETIYTTDMDALALSSAVRQEYYGKDGPWPATMWLQVPRLMLRGLMVEVEVIAELPGERRSQ